MKKIGLKSGEVPFRLSHCFELLIVIEGKGTINLGLEAFQLHADEACVIHPMQSYNIKTKHDESLEYFICQFDIFSTTDGKLTVIDCENYPLNG